MRKAAWSRVEARCVCSYSLCLPRSWGAGPRPLCDKRYLAAQPSAGMPPLTIRWGACQGRSRTPWLSLWPGQNNIYRYPDPLSSHCTSLPPWPGEGKQTRGSVTAPGPVVPVPGCHTRSLLSDMGTCVARPLSTLGTVPTRNRKGGKETLCHQEHTDAFGGFLRADKFLLSTKVLILLMSEG